ncbi:MAG TPA: DUF2157 domain-containing protein [Bacillota bacterium]|nr:DUF2157 domain-containing protein [Bacillota bacterium]
MSMKWLQREGQTWVEKKIITSEQYEEIIKLYTATPNRFYQVLPIFASLLVALSILSFVASNWGVIPQWGKLTVLFTTLVSFYATGFSVYRRAHVWLGQGLLLLGLATFGASMILIGQMFNLIAYDARLFVFWSIAGFVLLFLYRENAFYYATAVLLLAGQLYSTSTFHTASWMLLLLTIIGLGGFTYRSRSSIFGWILAPLIGIQGILLLTTEQSAWSWISMIPIGIYVVGLWLECKPMAQGFLVWPQVFSFGFSIVMVFSHHYIYQKSAFMAKPVPYLLLFSAMLLIGIWKSRSQVSKWLPMILFLPFFYLPFADMVYLVGMFVYASLLIYFGDQENEGAKSHIGVLLFMLSSFIGYIQLAWDFLNKSLFFLLGGIILFTIHWLLRKRRRWMRGEDKL